jgi:uncharacterized membrane protein required for colicin V production
MIAAATVPPADVSTMAFNSFDLVVVAVLGFGLFRGRRNGLSKDLLPLLQWLTIVPVCAFGYQTVGGFLMKLAHLDQFWSLLYAYAALALGVLTVFTGIKHMYAERLAKSNFFKGGEYYLGMVSGVVRYACLLVFLMALLNARSYTPAEIEATSAGDKQSFGGGLFAGSYFPHLFSIQDWVFKQSFTGSCVKTNLPMLLIATTPGEQPRKAISPPEPPKPTPMIKIGNPPPAPAQPTNPPPK